MLRSRSAVRVVELVGGGRIGKPILWFIKLVIMAIQEFLSSAAMVGRGNEAYLVSNMEGVKLESLRRLMLGFGVVAWFRCWWLALIEGVIYYCQTRCQAKQLGPSQPSKLASLTRMETH